MAKTVVMLDSFKPEYIKHSDYLKEKTKELQHGKIETPLGFWGGMDTFFRGSSDKLAFFYYTKNSSWRWIRLFTILGRFPVDVVINLWNLAHDWTLFKTNNIPLSKLHMFDTDVKRPIHKYAEIRYISFHELDGIAHKYGTESKEVKEEVQRLDKIVRKIKFVLNMDSKNVTRYWGEKPEGMPMDKCKIIGWKNKKYGDWIYLANPGVCFFPNYWQTKKCKAMHGYNPKLKDMKAFYILNKNGKKKNLTMRELHEYIK